MANKPAARASTLEASLRRQFTLEFPFVIRIYVGSNRLFRAYPETRLFLRPVSNVIRTSVQYRVNTDLFGPLNVWHPGWKEFDG